jgi:uncharacterized RDD family membrane protein YckC
MHREQLRRGAAFAIDVVILGSIAGLIENLFFLATPPLAPMLVTVSLYLLYFTLLEGFGATRATLGKRLFGLRVVALDGARFAPWRAAGRGALVAAILAVKWPVLFRPICADDPMAFAIGWAFPAAIMLHSSLIAALDHSGMMLEDRWTRTRVVSSSVAEDIVASPPLGVRPGLWAIEYVVLAVVALGGGVRPGWLLLDLGQEQPKPHPYLVVERAIEERTSEHLHFAARVSLDSMVTRAADPSRANAAARTLRARVRVPLTRWNESEAARMIRLVVGSIHLEPDAFDELRVEIETGVGLLVLTRSVTFDANKKQIAALYPPSLPSITTGPDGAFLSGEPPSSSSETANAPSVAGSPAFAMRITACPDSSTLISPRLAGRPPRIAHSS